MAERIRGRKGVEIRKRLRTQHPLCARCLERGIVRVATQMHHIVHLKDGGSNDPENFSGRCDECHVAEHTTKPTIGVDGWPIGG